jgi:DNA modification methylase
MRKMRAWGIQPTIKIRDRIRELRRVRAVDLLPNPRNYRRHPKEQTAALKGLLSEIGYADALLARELPDSKLMLIDGHLRAETTPDAMVPVLILDVNEAEADKLLLTLDPLASMAETDAKQMRALLATVTTDSDGVAALLERLADEDAWQGPAELQDPPAQIDKAAELQAKYGTALGQVWAIGAHRIVCGNSTDQAHVGRLWVDGGPKFRMIWTDPPYGVDYAGKNAYLNRSDRGNRIQKAIANDALEPAELRELFEGALRTATTFAERGASCYASVPSGPLMPYFIAGFSASGFSFKHTLVWVKNHFVIGMADYHHRFEPILYGWIENGPHYFVDDRTRDNVFEVDKPHVSDLHSIMKPVELIARMVANSSRPGELVFDPFAGSGSTILAAHQLGRIGYGVEISPEYCAVALERLAALGLEPKLVVRTNERVGNRCESEAVRTRT